MSESRFKLDTACFYIEHRAGLNHVRNNLFVSTERRKTFSNRLWGFHKIGRAYDKINCTDFRCKGLFSSITYCTILRAPTAMRVMRFCLSVLLSQSLSAALLTCLQLRQFRVFVRELLLRSAVLIMQMLVAPVQVSQLPLACKSVHFITPP